MAHSHPALPIVNVLASALLAAVAMYSAAPASCHPRRHVSLINPIHLYFDRLETQLEHDYPLLLRWAPDKLISQGRIDCRCEQIPGDPGLSHDVSQMRKQLRSFMRSFG
ncbi:hypothetical protein [Lysobacter sp. TAB13]|uniref:hypothetical protein n=1 Tax=Lysobacter sp. TAB13 TaxID=3233065 RepID=UPI003F9C33E3